MSLSFTDLDLDLQRSVFAAITILCMVLALSLIRFVHYILLAGSALASLYMAYVLFLKPLLKKKEGK